MFNAVGLDEGEEDEEEVDGELPDELEQEEVEYEMPSEEEAEGEEREDVFDVPEYEQAGIAIEQPNIPSAEEREKEHQHNIAAFMELLRSREVDPFRPWSLIAQELQNEPEFIAISSPKERESLFAAISPELAERIRSARHRGTIEAQQQWSALLASLTDAAKLPATWTEFSKHLRRTNPTLLKLLDTKAMEKQYRAHVQDLKNRAVTYNIKRNK